MPKYLLLKHYRGGPEPHHPCPPIDQWAPEDVEAHMAFQHRVSELLESNGEYVDGAGPRAGAHLGALRRPARRAGHHRRPRIPRPAT